jgi:hypothetical protein
MGVQSEAVLQIHPTEWGTEKSLCVPGRTLDPLTPNSIRHGDISGGTVMAGRAVVAERPPT